MPVTVLFLCTGNSARSQMAEAFLKHIGGDRFDVASAGSQPAARVHPMTEAVMEEINIPLSGAYPKHMSQFLAGHWDFVITVCDKARDACPTFPGDTQSIHWGFDDPAAAEGTEEERLRVFRHVRDEILSRIRLFAATFSATKPARAR